MYTYTHDAGSYSQSRTGYIYTSYRSGWHSFQVFTKLMEEQQIGVKGKEGRGGDKQQGLRAERKQHYI